MPALRDGMNDDGAFLCGVEMVTTRGTLGAGKGEKILRLAEELSDLDVVDWLSVTDNAGGNPMLAPAALGRVALGKGKNVLIHTTCKDSNRNGLESRLWSLAQEGFDNILAITGDFPAAGFRGSARPVFDLDSVSLLEMIAAMNAGLPASTSRAGSPPRRLEKTRFFAGATVNPFKARENELIPQYLKLEKKIACGARFIIPQIGYDSRKSHDLIAYLKGRGLGGVPLVGNVYVLNAAVARVFNEGRIPGVVVTDALRAECEKRNAGPDKGRAFFLDLAARQAAVFRGLGYRGVYLGNIKKPEDAVRIMKLAAAYASGDFKELAREILFARPGEFYSFAEDPETGLADPKRPLFPPPESGGEKEGGRGGPSPGALYRFSRWMHRNVFTPGTFFFRGARSLYGRAADREQGPLLTRLIEKVSKTLLFGCRDCGDCALPDTAFICPESRCAKKERNGPCGGGRDGLCEVRDRPCIWSLAYDRLKAEGREWTLLDHVPAMPDHALDGASSWARAFLKEQEPEMEPAVGRDGFEAEDPGNKGT